MLEDLQDDVLSKGNQTRQARKGTGFVNVGDLPSDDEDRDTDDRYRLGVYKHN